MTSLLLLAALVAFAIFVLTSGPVWTALRSMIRITSLNEKVEERAFTAETPSTITMRPPRKPGAHQHAHRSVSTDTSNQLIFLI